MSQRDVTLVRASQPTLEGAGVHLRRAFGFGQDPELFDPFLMMDDFRGDHPSQYEKGFPWHPHRGIETITYMIEGECDHGDSMGNSGTIRAGDVQWMTAGSGIIHEEMPHGDARRRMGGFQLWANLPAGLKMMDPRYDGVTADQIPVREADGLRVRVVSGTDGQVTGPVQDIVIDPEYFDVTLEGSRTWEHPTPADHTAFAYLFEGEASFGEAGGPLAAGPGTLVLLGAGDMTTVAAEAAGARFLYISGMPLREPVAWRGPIVMNTREQLDLAWRELEAGTFVKHAAAETGA